MPVLKPVLKVDHDNQNVKSLMVSCRTKWIFGRPKIIKNFSFWVSEGTFKPGFGTGIAENPQ